MRKKRRCRYQIENKLNSTVKHSQEEVGPSNIQNARIRYRLDESGARHSLNRSGDGHFFVLSVDDPQLSVNTLK